MARYTIEMSLTANAAGSVEFPEGKTWDDVGDFYIRYDTLYVQFEGSPEWAEFPLHSGGHVEISWKHPDTARVYPVDEDEGTDYSTTVAEF